MNKKSLATIQIVDLFGNPIPKAQYNVKNQKTGQLIAEGITNSKGCIVEISRDKGTILDVYIKSMFNGTMVKIQSFTLSKDRMLVKITSPKVLLDLNTVTNQGNSGKYKRKTHIVKKGETLTSIAQQNHTTVRALERLNSIDNPDKISIGQTIKLPVNIPASGNHAHHGKMKHIKPANPIKPKSAQSPAPSPKNNKQAKPNSDSSGSIFDIDIHATKQELEKKYEAAKQTLEKKYEEGKKAFLDGAEALGNIFTTDDRSEEGGTPKAEAPNLCKTNPQCISSGKSELIREINIRLAGFGGALPTDEFTELTAKCIKQFQRDYMGVAETGKICGSVLTALDKFRDEYGIASYFESMKCPCKKCSGFGNGRSGNFSFPTKKGVVNREATEYPGMHRSLIWGLKAMLFYFKKMPNPNGYKIQGVSSGYRCVERNFQTHRPTTNHMGCALDMQIVNKNNKTVENKELEDIVRIKWFCEYLNTSLGWHENKFGLERNIDGSTSWVHLDVREFTSEYKINKLFSVTKDGLNGNYLVNLFKADSNTIRILSCAGVVELAKQIDLSDISLEELIKQLGDVIAHGEGNYESYNSGTKNVEGDKVGYSFRNPLKGTVTGKTIKQIIENAKAKDGNDKNRLFATGKYQTTYYTLEAGIESGYFTGAEIYDANMQEKVFRDFLISKRSKLYEFVQHGKGTLIDAQYDAAQEWASVAVPNGLKLKNGTKSNGRKSFYEKKGQNSSSEESTKKVIEILTKIQIYHGNKR